MPIEFRCPSCDQQLRVPDTAAGKNAKCPKCASVLAVPATSETGAISPLSPPASTPASPGAFSFGNPPESQPASASFGTPPLGGAFGPPPPSSPFGAAPPSSPFGSTPPGSPFGSAPGGGNPFGGGGSNPFATDPKGPSGSPNPYASPTGFTEPPRPINSQGVSHQIVDIGPIMNHSLEIWQKNMGLLVGTTFVAGILTNAVNWIGQGVQVALQANEMPEASVGVAVVFFILQNVVQIFLGIGQARICLQLARYQPAEFGDLFKGGDRFLPMLGVMVIAFFALFLGFALLVVPGIILLLFYWPAYYLIVEEKAGVIESFGMAGTITEGNRLTTFLVWLLGVGIIMLGCLACGIGVLFAAPLLSMLWATAYLMMSGQLPTQPQFGQQQPQKLYT
ncbi:hypothetical protein ETAA8_04600 [Anatilimnocola aggregata]|uniref:Uncharacterized protein n=1 Tax=Anatilimnocola aggregata TaxID=2528021 RepID=A0A517Y5J0_9BACT|nr:hypothetical protein ETAA8_04600 [Anatilimnocola aggregata]